MANESNRIKPALIDADEESFAALKAIDNYTPANPAYTVPLIEQAHTEMRAAQEDEARANAAQKAARDNATAKEWNFHNLVGGSKDQVTAQFGRNSNEVQAIGRKKSSEHKAPQRKSKKGSGENSGS
ncbi:MAG: hypothetical protein ACJ74Q_04120 [Pyrinomonadaceae bacterium]